MERKINFAKNLKYYRENSKLTQRELAEHIGYTEKSISKWETGCGLPTMDIAVQLADYFSVSLEEMIFEASFDHYLLAIDGGGTKTVFVLADESGTELRRIFKSSTNPNDIGLNRTMEILDEGIREICRGIPFQYITMFAGLSGAGLTGNYKDVLYNFFSNYGFYSYDNGSDIENLIALVNQEKCILVIMGTGFIINCLDVDARRRIGGWGQLFDDGGCGYTIGRDAIYAALCQLDNSGRTTILTELITQRIGESISSHLSEFYTKGKQYIAGFSDLVFKAAEQNDTVATEILEKNMSFVANKIQAALKSYSYSVPVYFAGGISSKYEILFPIIRRKLSCESVELIYLQDEQIVGALHCAKQLLDKKRGEVK